MNERADAVDEYVAQWSKEWPELDVSPMETIGRINRLSRQMAPRIEALFASFGIERGEFDVLATLKRSGAKYRLTPTELFNSLLITSGGLTHRLKRLEKAGLVRRIPSEEDRRSLIVELTDKGHALVVETFAKDMALELSWLEALTLEERGLLADLLRRLSTAIGDPTDSAQS